MLALSNENMEQTAGYGLQILRVGLRDLGPYTCQAYNGNGPAASATYVLKVLGPWADRSSVSREDQKYLRYVENPETYRPPTRPPNRITYP